MVVNNFSLSPYATGRWVLSIEDRNILVNDKTKTLLSILQESKDLVEAHQKFQTIFTSQITFDDFETLIQNKLGGYNIFKNDSIVNPKIKIQFLKYKLQLLNAKWSGIIASPFTVLFKPQVFYYAFAILTFILLQAFFIYQPLKYANFREVNVTLLMFIVTPNIIFHELGHIAACRQFGIKHGGIGFAIYWIFPVFYADVNNVWTVDKWKRVIVNMGGIFNQVVYAFLLLVIFLIDKNYTLLYASFLVALAGLFQFNPFVRLDGYWILSDLSETPNLLSKGNVLLVKFFRRNFFMNFINNPIAKIREVKTPTLLIFSYGVINYTFIISFFCWTIINHSQEIINFPAVLYELFKKIISLKVEISDLKSSYVYIAIYYFLLWTMIKKLFNKAKEMLKTADSQHKQLKNHV